MFVCYSQDHTTGGPNGHFLHVDHTAILHKNARLSSPVFYPVTLAGNCHFRMWYDMADFGFLGDLPGLKVYYRTMIGGDMVLIWERTGELSECQ